MPRIRTLKPECLHHRKVGKLHDRAFRLWVAMILQADDEGRLVADLEQLRAVVFAYHARVKITDIDAALGELTRVGLVRRYTIGGVAYADFPSWHDHQRIDRPRPSMLPCFSEYTGLREDSSSPREDSSSPRANSSGLCEDSSSPRADRKGSEGIGSEGKGSGDASSPRAARDWPSPEALQDLYNAEKAPELPHAMTLTTGRRQRALALLKKYPDRAYWENVMREVATSEFLRGHRNGPGHTSFRADFDWLLGSKSGTDNAVKVTEGNYRNTESRDREPQPGYGKWG